MPANEDMTKQKSIGFSCIFVLENTWLIPWKKTCGWNFILLFGCVDMCGG